MTDRERPKRCMFSEEIMQRFFVTCLMEDALHS